MAKIELIKTKISMSETGVKYDKGFLCPILLLSDVMSETGRNLSYYRDVEPRSLEKKRTDQLTD